MHSISNHIAAVQLRVAQAARRPGRTPAPIRLVAASKSQSVDAIRVAVASGITDFGENYLSDALPKIEALRELPLHWHFIGAIQSNKTRDIARHFQWVQTLDRAKIAQRLSDQRPEESDDLDVLIQINIDGEPQKSGIAPDALAEFAAQLMKLPRIRLRGLMSIPRPSVDPEIQRLAFRRMRELFDRDKPVGATHWDTLSMGMTQDFEAAIAEGATMIRIGTALFGPRGARHDG